MKTPLFLFSIFTFILLGFVNAQTIQDPDYFHGPRTKWSKYPDISGGASRHSIIPQLSGLSVAEFMNYLEQTGANSATLNLETRRNLKSTPQHDLFSLTPELINANQYTAGQRSILLSNFLIDVQNAIDSGLIEGNIRFHIHQRLYLRKNNTRENQFITDFSNFINLCQARGVDHLIAGIRLGEHGTDGGKYLLQSALKVAEEINEKTDGWLKNFGGLEWSGDGYGRDFANINSQGNLSSTFFEEISKFTGYFTFCYKAFGISGELKKAGYNNNAPADWETFLKQDLGFEELKEMILAARDQYPKHANVIFIGDSGDALKQVGNIEYGVTTQLYSAAGDGFKGIIAVNGYRRQDKGTADNNLYFWDALTQHPPVKKTSSISRWQAWPYDDNKLDTTYKMVLAKAGIGGQIIPSGPNLHQYNSSPVYKIIPSEGYQIQHIKLNGSSIAIRDSITLNPITKDVDIQVQFNNSRRKTFTKPIDKEIRGTWIRKDKPIVWHFTNNYCIYQSSDIMNQGSFYGLYWYDYPDSLDHGEYLYYGEVITMNNDVVNSIYKLKIDSVNNDLLTVSYDDGTKNQFTRYRNATPVHRAENHIPKVWYSANNKTLLFDKNEYIQKLEIVAINGRKMYETKHVTKTFKIPEHWQGLYLVYFTSTNGTSQCQKIIVN